MGFELVVFDLAGTTVEDNDAVNRCFRSAMEAAGVPVEARAVNGVMGLPKREAIRRLLEGSVEGRRLSGKIEAIHADFTDRMKRFYREDPSVREVPGTSDVFRLLRRSAIKVAVNTGFSRDITGVLLERMGWMEEGLVDLSLSSDEVPRGRPYPDMVLEIMSRLGVEDPRRVAKVGDTPADLEEGAAAGCGLVVGVTGGTHGREELASSPHSHLIGTVVELPPLLGLGSAPRPDGPGSGRGRGR